MHKGGRRTDRQLGTLEFDNSERIAEDNIYARNMRGSKNTTNNYLKRTITRSNHRVKRFLEDSSCFEALFLVF